MEKIAQYDISSLQKKFDLEGIKKDFFFLEKETFYKLPEEPYRTETYGIGLYRKGLVKLKTGLITHLVEAPSIITMGPSVIRSWEHIDAFLFSSILFFREDFFLKNQANVFALKNYDFFENSDCHVLPLDSPTLNNLEIIFSQIRNTIAKNHLREAAIVRDYISILIHEIEASHEMINKNKRERNQISSLLSDKFKVILAAEFKRQRSVSFYASKLNMSPKHFSSVIKEQTGKTAGEWIDDMVILEAKVLLQNKALTITQIADHLNFNDASTFGKFFKSNTHLAPLEYRKSLD